MPAPRLFDRLSYPWRARFAPQTLKRGEELAAANAVQLLEEESQRVTGRCVGSRGAPYRVVVEVSDDGLLLSDCSCPVAVNCKHAVAVLLNVERRAAEHARQREDADTSQLSGDVRLWLSSLATSLNPPPAKSGWTLHYVIQDDVQVSVQRVRLRADGSATARAPFYGTREASFRQPGFMDPTDLRIAALLSLCTGSGNRFTLAGEHGGEALRLMLQSGRSFSDENGQRPLRLGAPRQAEFVWNPGQDGRLHGQWRFDPPGATLLAAVDPLFYLDAPKGLAGPVDHGLDPTLARRLVDAPGVPMAQVALFSVSLHDIAPQVPAPSKPTERAVDDLPPTPCLALGTHHFSQFNASTGRMASEQQHRAALSFDYAGARIHGKAANPALLRSVQANEVLRISRQPQQEQALRARLQALGFKPALRQSQALPKDSGEMYALANDAAWLRFAQQVLPTLRAEGWQIDVHPGFAFDMASVESWYAELDEPSDGSWFDLELGIVVEGQRISLLPLLLDLIRRNPQLLDAESLANRPDDEPLRVRLDALRGDGRTVQVALPLGRLKPILATLGELYQLDGSRPERLRLGRNDAARLATLEQADLVWRGGDRLLDFARRLRDYRSGDVQPPAGLRATLRPYQLDGLRWMQTLHDIEAGGILGDDMGLGKTLQALAHVQLEKERGRLDRPALVIMPTSLIPNWQDEAARFTPELQVLTLHGGQRGERFAHIGQADLVLTTYALLPRDIDLLREQPFHLVVLDEAQNIKNATTKASQAASRLQARQRLCLTGTPLENNLGEFWSLFNFLMPGWLGDSREFTQRYRTPIEKHGDRARLDHLVARVRPFILRRRKEQVAKELPPKTEMVHWVELTPAQRDRYEAIRVAMDHKVREEIDRRGLAQSHIVILDALLKLRQVCCDLRLADPAASHSRGGASGKLDSLMQLIEELRAEDRRVLLFSQFTSMLALIKERLQQSGIEYVQLTGESHDRRTPVARFQRGEVPVFLISLKAGGTGLNLTAADTVIHYDPWWNPAAENQATDRAYRIGQDKPVFVYKLIARGTVEEKIQQLQRRKAELASGLLDRTDAAPWQLDDADVAALFAPLAGDGPG